MRPVDDGFSQEAEDQIRNLLAQQPRPAMPPHLRDRVLAAVDAEPRPAAPGGSAGRSRTRWVGLAVAAALVILAGFIVVPVLRDGSGSRPLDSITAGGCPTGQPTAAANEGEDYETVAYRTGTYYDQAGLATQAQALLPECSGPSLRANPAAVLAPRAARKVVECIVRVAKAAKVMVADRGYYEDRRAVVAVVEPPRRVLALICRKDTSQVLEDVSVP